MRLVLALAATVAVPVAALAQGPAQPLPAGPPGELPPQPEQPEAEQPKAEPKVDPAYGERPDGTLPEPADGTKNFPAPRGKDIVIIGHADRSKSNITLLAVMGGSGLLVAAIGAYFHFDARDATNAVEASTFTGEPWTPARQDDFERAERSSTLAGVFYGIGGGLLLATAITYIATEPKSEKIIIHPHTTPKASALVAPTRGGAMVGGMWRF